MMMRVVSYSRPAIIAVVAVTTISSAAVAQQRQIVVDGMQLDSKSLRADLAKSFWQALVSTPCGAVAWAPDFTSDAGFAKSIVPLRARLQALTGPLQPAQGSILARTTLFSGSQYTIERVLLSDRLSITSFAYVVHPRRRIAQSATVILLHGSGMQPREAFGWTHQTAYRTGERANHAVFIGSALELADAGYTVYVPWLADDASTDTWPLLPWTALERIGASLRPRLSGLGALYLLLNQISGGVDYLSTLPDVDMTKLAVVGWGEGAHLASAASAADRRFAAVVRLAAPVDRAAMRSTTEGTFQDASFTHTDCALGDFEMAALIAPRPLLYSYATNDESIEPLTKYISLPVVSSIRSLYSALGRPNNIEIKADTGWSRNNIREVRRWLDQMLRFVPREVPNQLPVVPHQSQQEYRTAWIDSTVASRQAYTAGFGTCVPAPVEPDFTSLAAFQKSVEPFRRKVGLILGLETPPAMPRVTLIRRTSLAKRPGYSIDFVQFRSNRTPIVVSGLLTVPDYRSTGRLPALVSADGNAGLAVPLGLLGRERQPYLNAYADAQASAGTVVFVPYFPNEFPEVASVEASARTSGTKGSFSYMIPFFSASADFLLSLPEVDPSRLGIWGISYSGNAALFTAAMDTRFSSVVFSNPIVTAQVLFESQTSTALAAWWPEICSTVDAVQEYLIAPRRLIRENGLRDANGYERIPIESVLRTRDVYESLGLGSQFDFVRHDGGHETRPVNIRVFLH